MATVVTKWQPARASDPEIGGCTRCLVRPPAECRSESCARRSSKVESHEVEPPRQMQIEVSLSFAHKHHKDSAQVHDLPMELNPLSLFLKAG